jgi:outer membrane lipoprotein SlyB
VGKANVTHTANVISVREVEVSGESSGVGAAAGGIAGGIAGNTLGNGYGQVAGAAAGALLGAVASGAAEKVVTEHKALEYVVQLEDDTLATIVQNPKEGEKVFKAGDHVIMQTSGSYQRLLPTSIVPQSKAKFKANK